jgi:hypothetical protein
MKRLLMNLFVMILCAGFAGNLMAQSVTASSSATGTVVAPLTISNVSGMDFGTVAVQAGLGGTVVLATDGSRTVTGGCQIVLTGTTAAAAVFSVGGSGTLTYAITLPADNTITVVNGGNHMHVNTFVSDPSSTGQLTAGAQTLLVGATLSVSAAQATGVYTTGTDFDVTVAYN